MNSLAVLLLMGAMLTPTWAATLAFNTTTQATGNAGSAYANGIGHAFTVNSPITVNSLIFEGWSQGAGGIANAGDDAVIVRLWNVDTGLQLASFTFSGTTNASEITYAHGAYLGVRHEGSIGPQLLSTGVNYLVSADSLVGIQYINNATTQTIGAGITLVAERFGSSPGTLPTSPDGTTLKYGGPSFRFEAVPEPAAAWLALAILSAAAGRRRRA